MEKENQDGSEVLETTEETVEGQTADEKQEATQTDEEKENLKKEVDDLRKKNAQLYERVKKTPAKSESDISNKDLLFLAKTDVHEDDVDTLRKWAKVNDISLAEAYKAMKPILDVNTQQRATALATQTRGGQRGAPHATGEAILEKARRGELPESEADIEKLTAARLAERMKK